MKFSPLFVAMLPAVVAFTGQAATYQVVELGPIDGYKSSFVSGLNNNNQVVGNLSNRFNYPIDLNSVDFTNTVITGNLTAAEIEEVKKGNISAKALTVLTSYLQTSSTVYTTQRFAATYPARLDTRQLVRIRETAEVQTNNEYLLGINDLNQMIGYATAPFTRQSFTPAATTTTPNPVTQQLWVPSPMHMAGVIFTDKGKYILPPSYTDYGGGYSVGRGLNNTGKVIGYGSSNMAADIQTSIAKACDGSTEPKDLCFFRNAVGNAYETRGMVWQLDADGKPGTPQLLGFLGDKNSGKAHTRTEYPAVTYTSTPNDINDHGLVVGASMYSDSDDIRYYLIDAFTGRDEVYHAFHATIFDGAELKSFIDTKEWSSSYATGVNNKNIITGYAVKNINSTDRNRFFVYDYNTQKLTFPADLFASASTAPEAINDNNLIVGTTESATAGTSTRRNVGFLYDINANTFKDINTLLSCKSAYTIVTATDINEKNVIVATAIKEVERRDVKGELVKDSAGNVLKEEIAVAVQLNPIANGSIDNCDNSAEQTYERQGASFGLFGLLALLPLALRRRRH
ncbi:MAG: DUF3466 family protein [Rheinheimera sp.]|nr:MAG: DUF3466 family protein [Rheinheimera sp.]